MTCLELCAGAGGQALGLERAGFEHSVLVEIDKHCCATLSANRPHWNVVAGDLKDFDAAPFKGIDLLAGGLPCPPFSVAGKQLGKGDERNLLRPRVLFVAVKREHAKHFAWPVGGFTLPQTVGELLYDLMAARGWNGAREWKKQAEAPGPDFAGTPRLTVRMAARLQGFPDEWQFAGGKTSAYGQVGNAFPPPVVTAIAGQIKKCLAARKVISIAG